MLENILTCITSALLFFFEVNHLPGSGFITLKVELATSKLKWTPRAFRIPGEKQALLKEAGGSE